MALPMATRFIHRSKHGFATAAKSKVRVRFAPSPTGMLHLGGLRTALFNYLFAKSKNGAFVMRIEDTDTTRIVPGAVQKLEEMLLWSGLVPDESPTAGGSYGPYVQSQRLNLYEESIKTLLKSGHCYRCFCTSKRLALLRKEAARSGEAPRYDNKCRDLTPDEIQTKLDQNVPFVYRFKYEPITSPWDDLVYGRKHEDAVGEALEGDFIVIKTDGWPTYHFANVVDDHHMQISHVLRGEEWSISTPKHLQMYAAFGWTPPLYAHLPLILNSNGTKLSKRQGDIQVENFKDKEIEPEALLNYLTSVNKGFIGSTEGKTLQELVEMFSLDTLNTHSSRLQPEKLGELNRLHLQRQFHTDKRQELINRTKTLLREHFGNRLSEHVLQDSYIEAILTWALEHRVCHLEDLNKPLLQFIWVVPSQHNTQVVSNTSPNCEQILARTLQALTNIQDFTEDVIKSVLQCICKENDVSIKAYMTILRNCLSDVSKGPGVAEMMEVLGQTETLKRIEYVHNMLRKTDRNNNSNSNNDTNLNS